MNDFYCVKISAPLNLKFDMWMFVKASKIMKFTDLEFHHFVLLIIFSLTCALVLSQELFLVQRQRSKAY